MNKIIEWKFRNRFIIRNSIPCALRIVKTAIHFISVEIRNNLSRVRRSCGTIPDISLLRFLMSSLIVQKVVCSKAAVFRAAWKLLCFLWFNMYKTFWYFVVTFIGSVDDIRMWHQLELWMTLGHLVYRI